MKIRNINLVLLLVMVLHACIPEPLEVNDIPEAERKMVVSSTYILPYGVATVLSWNYSALSGDIEGNPDLIDEVLIRGAEVVMSVGGENYPMREIHPGLYIANDPPLYENVNYQLSAHHPPTGERISAETKLIKTVDIISSGVTTYISDNDTFPRVDVTFRDAPEKNWYMINVQVYEQPLEILETFLHVRVYNRLLTDEGRNGDLITENFTAFVGEEVQPGDSIVVSLTNISKGYYEFLEKRNNRFFALDLVSEPFNLPSNVSNGYGYFGLHTTVSGLNIVR